MAEHTRRFATERQRRFAEMLAVRAYVELLMSTRPLDEVVTTLARVPCTRAARPGEQEAIGELTGRWLRNRRFPRTTCLQRALTRFAMLKRRGIATTFVVGVREGSDPLVGHAWLEQGGVAILEPDVPDCTPTFRYSVEA